MFLKLELNIDSSTQFCLEISKIIWMCVFQYVLHLLYGLLQKLKIVPLNYLFDLLLKNL